MATRSYSAVSDGSNRLIAIDAHTGVQIRSLKLQDKILSVSPTGDTVTVVTENHAGVIRSNVFKLPQLSMVTSMHIGNAPRKSSLDSSRSTSKPSSASSSQQSNRQSQPSGTSSGGGGKSGPPRFLDDDEDSLKSLLSFSGFFSLFTILGRAGNTMKRITGKSYNGECLTKRDWKVLGLMVVVLFVWATCSGDSPKAQRQQVQQSQLRAKQLAQRQAQLSPVRVPPADTIVDTKHIAERMAKRQQVQSPPATGLSDNPEDNTPPNFPNDLPRGFKRVFINSPVGYLNMRSGPDTNSAILCQIPNNEVIYVENEDKLWLRAVRPRDNNQGYVNSGRLGEFAFPFSPTR